MSRKDADRSHSRPGNEGRITPEYIIEQLNENGILLLCAEPGMGRTTLLTRLSTTAIRFGHEVRFEDCGSMRAQESLEVLERVLRWSKAKGPSSSGALVVIDNLPDGDEADVEAQAKKLRGIVSLGCMAAVSLLPEGQMLAEILGEAACYWSCDLTVPAPATLREHSYYETYTHGIPALVEGLQKSYDPKFETLLCDPCFQEAYTRVVANSLRNGILHEELVLRATLLLLGRGTRADIKRVLGSLDDELWRTLGRDAPVFGIDASQGEFCCVGAPNVDALHVTFALLRDTIAPKREAITRVVELLVERGDISRAGVVTLMEKDARQRCKLGLAWSFQFLNAGEIGTVVEAVNETREFAWLGLEGFWDAACALWALGIEDFEGDESATRTLSDRGDLAPATTLAIQVRERLQKAVTCKYETVGDAGEQCEGLVTWLRAFDMLVSARVGDAYELLVNESSRLQTSVVGSLLMTLYILSGLIMGALPTDVDIELWSRMKTFLRRSGLGMLQELEESVFHVGMLLGGTQGTNVTYEAMMRRANRGGNDVVYAAFLMFSGICDLRIGAFTRSHVRLDRAVSSFAGLGMKVPEKISRLLDLVVRFQLGEAPRRVDLTACRGAGASLDRVVSLVYSALFPGKRPSGGRFTGSTYPHELHWLINILCFDCRDLSRRILAILPSNWPDAVRRRAKAVDALGERAVPRPTKERERKSRMPARREDSEGEVVEVQLLGGFEVLVRGEPIDTTRLERRGARNLLVFLSAVPGHVAKRFVIMESLWPNHDYNAANRCVYGATSVLRNELASAVDEEGMPILVLTSKSEGTISLDGAIACDVDKFEQAVRGALDQEGNDAKIVELARTAEELYRGDLIVPPHDGMGVLEARALELRNLFADVMVAGSHAAINLGYKMLACRFASKAHEADVVREDAMRALATAYCAAGRHVEAERCYEDYVGYLADHTGMPPSRTLRDDIRALLETSRRRVGPKVDSRQLELGFES